LFFGCNQGVYRNDFMSFVYLMHSCMTCESKIYVSSVCYVTMLFSYGLYGKFIGPCYFCSLHMNVIFLMLCFLRCDNIKGDGIVPTIIIQQIIN